MLITPLLSLERFATVTGVTPLTTGNCIVAPPFTLKEENGFATELTVLVTTKLPPVMLTVLVPPPAVNVPTATVPLVMFNVPLAVPPARPFLLAMTKLPTDNVPVPLTLIVPVATSVPVRVNSAFVRLFTLILPAVSVSVPVLVDVLTAAGLPSHIDVATRSEEHTSELQSLRHL